MSMIGPILWGHSSPLCHALSLLSLVIDVVVDIDAQAACDSSDTCEWQCKTGGVWRLAVVNGPNIFQMLLVLVMQHG